MKQKDDAPLFSSWNVWYFFVIGVLVLLVGFFFWLTERYA